MTEQDFDTDDDMDTTGNEVSLEDIDALYSYVVDSNDSRDDYEV
jgi:hypothetical protein